MNIRVNGEPLEIGPECTVRNLLERFQLHQAACAVEINRQLVPKRQHAERRLTEGDEIEVVTLVGGG